MSGTTSIELKLSGISESLATSILTAWAGGTPARRPDAPAPALPPRPKPTPAPSITITRPPEQEDQAGIRFDPHAEKPAELPAPTAPPRDTNNIEYLLGYAPDSLWGLPDWFDMLTNAQLDAVWTAAIADAITNDPHPPMRALLPALLKVRDRLRKAAAAPPPPVTHRGEDVPVPPAAAPVTTRVLSADHKAKLAEATRARWERRREIERAKVNESMQNMRAAGGLGATIPAIKQEASPAAAAPSSTSEATP